MAQPSVTNIHKSHARVTIEPLMVVEFDEPIGIKEINPTWSTFQTHNVNDTVCYKFPVNDRNSKIFEGLPAALGVVCWAFGLLVGFVFYFIWLFEDDE